MVDATLTTRLKPAAESEGLQALDVLRVTTRGRDHLADRVIAAICAPTSLAVAAAEASAITLIACARDDAMNVYTHAHRIR